MQNFNHSRLDLLKIDIEGAEYTVLNQILNENIQINLLCVEFDQPMAYSITKEMINRLSE